MTSFLSSFLSKKKIDKDGSPTSPRGSKEESDKVTTTTVAPVTDTKSHKEDAKDPVLETIPLDDPHTPSNEETGKVRPKSSDRKDVLEPIPLSESVKKEEIPPRELKNGDLSLNIYESGKTFVQEVRAISLNSDRTILIQNLPGNMNPARISFRSITHPNAALREQSFLNDQTLTLENILRRHIDGSVHVYQPSGEVSGILLEQQKDSLLLKAHDDKGASVVSTTEASHILLHSNNPVFFTIFFTMDN